MAESNAFQQVCPQVAVLKSRPAWIVVVKHPFGACDSTGHARKCDSALEDASSMSQVDCSRAAAFRQLIPEPDKLVCNQIRGTWGGQLDASLGGTCIGDALLQATQHAHDCSQDSTCVVGVEGILMAC